MLMFSSAVKFALSAEQGDQNESLDRSLPAQKYYKMYFTVLKLFEGHLTSGSHDQLFLFLFNKTKMLIF